LDACVDVSDCCSGLNCDGFECRLGTRQCGQEFDSCVVDPDCCSGVCDNNVCGRDTGNGGQCGEELDSCELSAD
jgi:hypothetical protein